jgi:hypothetical protein
MPSHNTIPLFRLSEKFPECADFLRETFAAGGRPDLVAQVEDMIVYDACSCRGEDCCTFYTSAESGPWIEQGGVAFDTEPEIVAVDTSADKIVCVEILRNYALAKKLHELVPGEG